MPASFQLSQKVFLVRDGTFLVLRDRAGGHGDLPGGRLDDGELHGDLAASVRRELAEELGPEVRYLLEPEPRFWFKHHIQASGMDAIGLAWVATCTGGAIRLSEEHAAMWWKPITGWDASELFITHQLAAVRRFQAMGG